MTIYISFTSNNEILWITIYRLEHKLGPTNTILGQKKKLLRRHVWCKHNHITVLLLATHYRQYP